MDNNTSKKIDNSLADSAKAIETLKKNLRDDAERLPQTAIKLENRLQELQQELNSVSDKMLAYKLKRLAGSKMLESVSNLPVKYEGEPAAQTAAEKNTTQDKTKDKKTKSNKAKSNKTKEYQSNTFKCKSDLDTCLLDSKNSIDKALCYALFIRCAIKG